MTPSVEGRRKAVVAALLIGSAAATGALIGFVVGVAWLVAGPPLPWAAVVALVGTAGMLDLLAVRRPAFAAPSVGRQVPREWARYFSPPTVAVLFGARLGVGPATILPSWLWWAVVLIAAADGVGTSVAAGAVFGGVRTLLMVGLAEWVHRAAAVRMARLRSLEGAVRIVLPPVAVVVVGVAALTA